MLSLIPACLLASSVDCFGVFANSSLLIGFFGWPLWGFRWFRLAYWLLSVDRFGAFADFSLPIGFFRLTALGLSLISACLLASFSWPLWGFRWFQLAYWFLSVDCFGAFADFSLPIGFFRLTALTFSLILACLSCFFGWLLWGLFLFQLAYRSSLVDCFSAFADSSLPIGLLWLTALALSLISACFLASLVDCFGDFFYFSLPIGLFRLTALALSLIPACLLASLVDCFGAFADSSLPISFFGWLLWDFRWFRLAY